jgi:ribonucleoside-triphosphate reductase
MGEMNSAVARKYALDYIVSPMARENHLGNMIYIHDLDAYAVGSHNCLTIPFDDLLQKALTPVRPMCALQTP